MTVAPGPLVWHAEPPSGGDYTFSTGERYAVLASVSKNYGEQEVRDYLTSSGWTVTYAWEQGQASRGAYPIDAWLDALAPDTRDNHRWLYAEANRTGPSTSIGAAAPWPLTIYQIASVFRAVPAPPTAPGALPEPVLPAGAPAPAAAAPAPAIALLGGGFALGLAASLLAHLVRRLL
jgi:hypothetical protein